MLDKLKNLDVTKLDERQQNLLKFSTEMIPLIMFYLFFKLLGLYVATIILFLFTLGNVVFTYKVFKKLHVVPMTTAIFALMFSLMTIATLDTDYVQLYPSVLNTSFAIFLFTGFLLKKGFMRFLFGESVSMSEAAWLEFSYRWAIFYICLAALNEIIWRNFSHDSWVFFMVFCVLPLTISFTVTQMPFLQKHRQENYVDEFDFDIE